jgi:hypothetical protein
VIDTNRFVFGNRSQIFGGFFIMAMTVIDPFVAPIVLSAKSDWDNMIDLEQITITKVESTSWALSLLHLEELCLFVVHEWMLFEPFYPVKEITVIWA